jgi:hypothetical protein
MNGTRAPPQEVSRPKAVDEREAHRHKQGHPHVSRPFSKPPRSRKVVASGAAEVSRASSHKFPLRVDAKNWLSSADRLRGHTTDGVDLRQLEAPWKTFGSLPERNGRPVRGARFRPGHPARKGSVPGRPSLPIRREW